MTSYGCCGRVVAGEWSGTERCDAAVDWSYQLLTAEERCLFDRVSVFAGGFDLAAVEAICDGPSLEAADVFDVLASLVDKSMVVADRGVNGTRYRLLETLRQFAAERLTAGEAQELRERHLGHYLDVAEEANRLSASRGQLTGDGTFERDWDNLRAAHAWAVATTNVQAADRIVAATDWYAHARARHEHGDWARRTLELASAGLHPASATHARAAFAALQAGETEPAITFAERGLRAAPSPDHPDAASCWWVLILAYLGCGREGAAADAAQHLAAIEPGLADPIHRWAAMQGLIESALATDRGSVPGLVDRLTERAGRIGAPSILSQTSYYQALGALSADPRDPEKAFTASQTGVTLARTVGDLFAERANLSTLAMSAAVLRRPDAAEICRDAISRIYDCRMWHVVWIVVETVAGFFAATGRLHEAAVLYGHLEAHRPPFGVPAIRRARQRGLDRVRQLTKVETLMAQGTAMDRDELVAYILDRLGPAAPPQVEPA